MKSAIHQATLIDSRSHRHARRSFARAGQCSTFLILKLMTLKLAGRSSTPDCTICCILCRVRVLGQKRLSEFTNLVTEKTEKSSANHKWLSQRQVFEWDYSGQNQL